MDRRSLLARAGVALLPAGLAGCFSGDDEEPTPTPGETETPTRTETPTKTRAGVIPQTVQAVVGERVDGQTVHMAVQTVERTRELGRFQRAEDGTEFVRVRFVVKNVTDEEFLDFREFLVTKLTDGQGNTYEREPIVTGQQLPAGHLVPGEVARADVVYQVPQESSGLTMRFEVFPPFVAVRKLIVDLSTTADQPAEFSQDLGVPVEPPGKTISLSGGTVTVHSVETTGSIGDTQARPGQEFVVADVSVANDGDAERTFTPNRHTVCKDGRGLSYRAATGLGGQLENGIAGERTVPAGETVRGSIPYGVATDAEKLYWAFEFTLWNGGQKTFWRVR